MSVIYKKKGAIAYVTISREEAYNALNKDVFDRLETIFLELETDNAVMVVVVTGAGDKAFVAGADVKEVKEAGKKRPELVERGQNILSMIRTSCKVVIAAVNGYALGGGCELAMSCDIRIASENARFGLPEAKLGLMPGYGGTQLLPRLVGSGRAKYLMFSGDMITAGEALQMGLVDKVCLPEKLMKAVDELAKKISSNGPLAIKAIKRAVNGGIERPLEEALKLELREYGKLAFSKDAEDGMAAFSEKRTPTFKGE